MSLVELLVRTTALPLQVWVCDHGIKCAHQGRVFLSLPLLPPSLSLSLTCRGTLSRRVGPKKPRPLRQRSRFCRRLHQRGVLPCSLDIVSRFVVRASTDSCTYEMPASFEVLNQA